MSRENLAAPEASEGVAKYKESIRDAKSGEELETVYQELKDSKSENGLTEDESQDVKNKLLGKLLILKAKGGLNGEKFGADQVIYDMHHAGMTFEGGIKLKYDEIFGKGKWDDLRAQVTRRTPEDKK